MKRPTRPIADRLAGSGRGQRLLESFPGADELIERFLAGDHPAHALVAAADLTSKGMDVSFTQTALHARDLEAAHRVAESYREVIALSGNAGIKDFDVCVGTAALGGRLGGEGQKFAARSLREIAAEAQAAGATMTLDAGAPGEVDEHLALVADLRREVPSTGISLLACLRRTTHDIVALAQEGARVRLLKGNMPLGMSGPQGRQGFVTQGQVDRNYVRLLRQLMESPAHPVVATHDHRIVSITHELVKRTGRSRDDYEFQMRMGVRPFEHRRLVDTGRRVRVLVPFGEDWYGYVIHRLADKPQGLGTLAGKLVFRR